MTDYIIIGAGQAGLAMAYYLKLLHKNYIILDANSEIGAPWLKRWDSLKLFTPSEFNNLPGMNFPHKKGHYADKYEIATYLKSYVKKFDIPVRSNQKVSSLHKIGDSFLVQTQNQEYKAKNIIIATGPFHSPYTPTCTTKVNADVFQIHSEHYKGPNQLQDGDTLVVGAGDSGIQILNEISEGGRKVYFSGDTAIGNLPQEFLGKTLWWWLTITGILSASKYSWLGRKLIKGTQPIIGTDVKSLFKRKNISCIGKTIDANKEDIIFEKRRISSIKNIIWATGFKPNFDWIEGVELDEMGYPKNFRGISNTDGIYYIGLPWLHTRGSATLGGVKKDALFLSQHIKKIESEHVD
jgi:putative flavoprotein involved in K+ transport